MEARILSLLVACAALSSVAATHRTANFVVSAPTAEIAQQVAEHAEHYRHDLAIRWLGKALPRWYAPCPIQVKIGQMGAGGATTFSFDRGEVSGWNMTIQGSLERVLDSVLPHEVSHTIFACHFRRPLPRWADEGAATLAENESERLRQTHLVRQILGTKKRIPLRNLLKMTEYPADMQDVMTLYAEGYSLCDLLVQRGGKARYLAFLTAAHKQGWDKALQVHYDIKSIDALEKDWQGWIVAGCPSQNLPKGQQLAQGKKASDAVVTRSQSPDEEAAPVRSQPVRVAVAAPQARAARGRGLEAPSPKRLPDPQVLADQVEFGDSQPLSVDGGEFEAPLVQKEFAERNTARNTESDEDLLVADHRPAAAPAAPPAVRRYRRGASPSADVAPSLGRATRQPLSRSDEEHADEYSSEDDAGTTSGLDSRTPWSASPRRTSRSASARTQ